MLTKIIAFSVRNKLIIGLMVLALIGYGSYQVTKLPIDAVPDITNNQIQVITVAPSFGATDIERLVTFPIEQANTNIAGIKEIRSFSRFGLSLVTIVFDDATDVFWARQQVAERLQQVQTQIPKGLGTPTLGPITTGLGEIYQYVVKPKKGYEQKYDAMQLRTIQDWLVRRQLLGVKGVAEVSSFGGYLKQFEVAINTNKLNAFGITVHDVFNAIEANNQNTGGAYIEKNNSVLYIRSEGLIQNIADIENISIVSKGYSLPLFIRDVAEVKIGQATRYGAMCYNDEGEVSGAVVMMLKGANSSEVIKNVKERITLIQKTLPEGVVIEPFLDRTKMVSNAIGTVEQNLLEGALIVVFILVLFLSNFRAGLLVASVIPLAMLFAICMMNAFGVSGNLMSLGALDFGLIVDGAVIIVEAVMHQLSHNKKLKHLKQVTSEKMNEEVTSTAGKMMNSAVFGQIIILIVYLPIFSLQGIEGKMFKPMAQTVAFALLGAFILSLTYIPMMSAFFLSKKIATKKNMSDKAMAWLEQNYQRRLTKLLRHPKWVLTTVIALFVSAICILVNLGGEFIPALEEGDFAVDTRLLTGSSLSTTIETTQKAAHILKTRFPEVEKVVTKIGSGEVPTDPMPMEACDMMVILKDKKFWTSAKTFNELSQKMNEALDEVPGITVGFQFPVQMRFNELMTGARQDVVCKIFGENLDTLAATAERLAKVIGTVKGAADLFVEPVTGQPQIVIDYNRQMIAQYHLSIADINKVVNTAFAGQSTGQVFEDEKRFDLVVKLAEPNRKSLEDVQNLLVPTPNGNQIPLYQLATVQLKDGPNQIQREDAKRRIVVGFNVRGRDVQSIVQELQTKVDQQLHLPAGYYATYGGAFENLNKAKNRLMIAVPVSLLLIFVLLYFAFNSVKQGLLIYTAIPLSAIGGIFFLALRGMPFSISAGVGFIALFGVAVLNGIVLIAEFNRLRASGMNNLAQVVITGTRLRLRPVLMTAFVASLGFLPMAVSNGAGAEVQRPLATVVIGGLLLATLLTLFVLPILYILFEKGIKKPTMKQASILLLIAMLCSNSMMAQQKITLDAAISTALKNNQQIKDSKLKEAYSKAMIASAAELPKTNAIVEYGQINSYYSDSRIGIVQQASLPTIYKKQKQLLTQEWSTALANVSLKEFEIKKAITALFYEYQYLIQKKQLLQQADTLYNNFFTKANLRLQKGESNVLEKTTAETQKASIDIQLKQVQQSIALVLLELQLLLNTSDKLDLVIGNYKLSLNEKIDTANLVSNPSLQVIKQQKAVAEAQTAVEKAKRLPDFSLGYLNNSFIGTGADNKTYTASNRFSSVQVGVGIPIFTKAQKAKEAAAKVQEGIYENQYQAGVSQLQNQYAKLIATYTSQLEVVKYYEQTGLKSVNTIQQTATKQFLSGEINYLDFVILINQAITIQSNYVDAVKALNETIFQINFLTAK
jgi:cobalt-zinc-cadmium resistance protein CzcA